MAIKVKHEGNVTSRITAATAGGRGKRASDDGKAWMQIAAQEAMAGNRQLQGAHASPVAPGHASAQLTHAPTGAAPGIMHAPSGGVHGRGGGGGGRSGAGAGTGAGDSTRRLKVTGNKFFERPDKESVWDQDSRQWVREYLPGEWEAEAQQRIGDVKNAQQKEMLDYQAGIRATETEEAQRRKEADRKAAQEEWDRQHGIMRRDKEEDLVRAGTHEWGYSPETQKQIAQLREDYNKAVADGTMSEDDKIWAKRQMEKQIAALPMQAVPRSDAEGVFRQNTYTDDGGRIFSRDGKLLYDPGTAEQRKMEYQMKMHDAEEKRYQDALLKLEQGHKTTQESEDMAGVKTYKDIIVPYTDEQKQAILQRIFPNRFANVAQPTASAPGIVIDPTTGVPTAAGMAAINQPYPGAPLAQPAPTSTAPTPQTAAQAQPQAQAAPPPTAPEDEKKKYAVSRWGVK